MKEEQLIVLLVEDDLDHKELIVRHFNTVKKRIEHVSAGEAALNYLHRRGEFSDLKGVPLPNLILLDLRLPKIDGLEVLKEIKSSDKLQYIPVVILTTSESENDLGKAYKCHANSYLVKPFDLDEFIRLMSQTALYWLRHNKMSYRKANGEISFG